MASIGSERLLGTPRLALLCSRACPGAIIVQTLDAVRALRESPWTVVGGFQSPSERACLEILLRAECPVIVCPARSVEGMRLPLPWIAAIAAGHKPTAAYRRRLGPSPGPSADAAGNFLPLPEWKPVQSRPANWPRHIHAPREVHEWALANGIDWRTLLEPLGGEEDGVRSEAPDVAANLRKRTR